MRKRLLVSIGCLVLVASLAGCAARRSASISGLKTAAVIDGTRYVTAESLCQIYSLIYHWDPVAKKLTFKKDNKEARMMVNSATALLNDNVCTMEKEVRFYQGSAVIPESFAGRMLRDFFREERVRGRSTFSNLGLPLRRVIIDPGHGGKDPGAVGRRGLLEKDVVLDIAKRLKGKLRSAGIDVILTRDTDEFISLEERGAAGNANSNKADFFISIHANASRSRWVKGVEVLYLSEAIDEDTRSLKASKDYELDVEEDYCGDDTAAIIWDLIYRDDRKSSQEMAELICSSLSKNLSQKSRGTKPARFQVLKTNLPAILIEVGFISNSGEEKKLSSTSYRNKIAQAIARGILEYNRKVAQGRTVRR